jgi:hypothetical protein
MLLKLQLFKKLTNTGQQTSFSSYTPPILLSQLSSEIGPISFVNPVLLLSSLLYIIQPIWNVPETSWRLKVYHYFKA